MPHYKDGTEAKVGDVVKGKGYNVKGPGGQLAEIVGTVVGITPGSSACNIQIAHVQTFELERSAPPNYRLYHQIGVIGCGPDGGKEGTKQVAACIALEYGQCDSFEKIS